MMGVWGGGGGSSREVVVGCWSSDLDRMDLFCSRNENVSFGELQQILSMLKVVSLFLVDSPGLLSCVN